MNTKLGYTAQLPTDLQLQLALARELPELVDTHTEHATPFFIWRDTDRFVTPREWDWIVRECEKKITTQEQSERLWRTICDVCEQVESLSAAWPSWQERATALTNIGAITVEKEVNLRACKFDEDSCH